MADQNPALSVPRAALIALCPEHGLHGDRSECFVCGGEVVQVPYVAHETHQRMLAELRAENERLREALLAVRTEARVALGVGGWVLSNETFEKVRGAIEWDGEEHAESAADRLIASWPKPLDDPAAMSRATEAVQVSGDMPHDRRAAYIVGAALDPEWGRR